jgi:ATP-dependent DNA ligase
MACLNVPSDAGLVLAVTLSVLVSHWGGVASPKARHACPQSGLAISTASAKPVCMSLEFIKPQLATSVDQAPPRAGWIHEVKHDGYHPTDHRAR